MHAFRDVIGSKALRGVESRENDIGVEALKDFVVHYFFRELLQNAIQSLDI